MDGVILVLLLLATPQTLAQDTTVDDIFGSIQRYFKAAIGGVLATKSDTRFYRANLKFRDKAARKLPPTAQFPCDLKNIKLRSDKIPESVHKLRPGDIDIIGAFGDSLSAGTGTSAVTIAEELFVSQRGRAFSGGGERTWRSHLTLPNILKEFNPNLFGFALRASQSFEWEAQFNVAKNGAKSSDTPKLVKELVNKIKRDPRVDVNKHWKMVTLMIGDNDFCSEVCKLNNYYHSLEKHREDLYQVLRYLKQNLPRTLVNIVPPPRLNILYEMKYLPLQCCIVQHLLCPCIRGLQGKNVRETLNDIMRRWQEVEIEIGQMSEWQSEDFAVIVQYFTLNYTFPRTPRGEVDYGYLAPDCFHLSEKGQARYYFNMWMLYSSEHWPKAISLESAVERISSHLQDLATDALHSTNYDLSICWDEEAVARQNEAYEKYNSGSQLCHQFLDCSFDVETFCEKIAALGLVDFLECALPYISEEIKKKYGLEEPQQTAADP